MCIQPSDCSAGHYWCWKKITICQTRYFSPRTCIERQLRAVEIKNEILIGFTGRVIRINEIENEFSGRNDLSEGAAAPADEVVVAEAVAATVQVVHLEHQLLLLLEVVGHVRSGRSKSFLLSRASGRASYHGTGGSEFKSQFTFKLNNSMWHSGGKM